MNRDESLRRLRTEKFDVLVIGGGITGCGIALDAASRGLKVALVERGDFAGGTSSRSSKLIHGGLRYLGELQFRVTLESSREKTLLKRLAPHLIDDLPFLLPVRSLAAGALLASGLWIYDAAAGFPQGLLHRKLSSDEALRELPLLDPAGLRGAFVYHDSRADDCRLVLHVARKAADLGAALANYVGVTALLHSGGRISGARGGGFDIAAARVVNATGVWCDEVRRMDDPSTAPLVSPSMGVHLVVPARRLPLRSAAVLSSPTDRRIVFLIPAGESVIIGTTDTPYSGPLDRPSARDSDVRYLLDLVNGHLPGLGLGPRDIRSTFAGLRPLLLDSSAHPSRASRDHRILESASGLITVSGGKLTTYRRMAREVVDLLTPVRCRTDRIDLYATPETGPLAQAYGCEARRIVDRSPIASLPGRVWGEIDHHVDLEMARTLADVLARRLRAALYAEDRGLSLAEPVARRMASRLGWDAAEIRRQVDDYGRYLQDHHPR